MDSINLGRKSSCLPEPSKPEAEESVHYPTVYIDNVPGLSKLPEEGTVTFRYKKVRSTTEKLRDGETRQSASLDLLEITDFTEESEKKVEDREDALDKLAKQAESDDDESDEDEQD